MGRNLNSKVLVGITIAIIFSGTLISQEVMKKRLDREKIKVEKELEELKLKNKELTEEFDDSKTDEYIERMARERLGMIKKGEKVIID